MEVQSNFVALIQTDVDTSEFTKSFPCQHLAHSLLYLDESNSIQFTYLRERTMRKEKQLTWKQHFSLHHLCQMLNARVFFSFPRLTLGWSGWKSCD